MARRTSQEVRDQWSRLAAMLVLAFLGIGTVLTVLYVAAGVWPPFVAVGSRSMQHGEESAFGVMDPGDVVFIRRVSSPDEVVTYVEGRATGYMTYGDFGDVVVIQDIEVPSEGLVLHRALTSVVRNLTACAACYDLPELGLLDDSEWEGWNVTGNATGAPTKEPYGLVRFAIRDAGWRRDQLVDFPLWRIRLRISGAGILTFGDGNLYPEPTGYDLWIVPLSAVLGTARGEIPWFGLIALSLSPEPLRCCESWGSTDPIRGAPENSWQALEASLAALAAGVAGAVLLTSYRDRRRRAREEEEQGENQPRIE